MICLICFFPHTDIHNYTSDLCTVNQKSSLIGTSWLMHNFSHIFDTTLVWRTSELSPWIWLSRGVILYLKKILNTKKYSNFNNNNKILLPWYVVGLAVMSLYLSGHLLQLQLNQYIECWECCCYSYYSSYVTFLPHPRVRVV